MVEGVNILGNNEMQFYNQFENKISILPNLKKVNIFIGENNCGKSRLMRNILGNISIMYSEENIQEINRSNFQSCVKRLKSHISQLISFKNQEVNDILEGIELNCSIEMLFDIQSRFETLERIKSKLNKEYQKFNNIISLITDLGSLINEALSYLSNSGNCNSKQKNIIYIPTLRGIENFEIYFGDPTSFENIKMTPEEYKAFEKFKDKAKTIYLNKVANVYKIDSSKIFTAENLYESIMRKLLNDENSRNFIHEFEKFITQNFYNEIEFSITPNIDKNFLGIKIGKNPDRALYNLGEGIKQLISIFYKIYEQKDNDSIFLIEEPELNLHPGFQRKFIEIITNEFPKHQFIITTHSNHIIDLYNEQDNIAVYKFRNSNQEKNKFYVDRVTSKDLSILDDIGAKCSSVFISNCTIWVEGISDKIYISKYLKLYFESIGKMGKYKEDIHYSFVEYGGNNITHWSFIDDDKVSTINSSTISHKTFVVCDNDDNKKENRKNKLREALGEERVYVLNSREIENLLSKKVLEKTLKCDNNIQELIYKRKTPYSEKNYATSSRKMANFIDETFYLKKKYSGNYGSLKNKVEFAKIAIEQMEKYDDLTEEAKELTKNIYEFIKECNK